MILELNFCLLSFKICTSIHDTTTEKRRKCGRLRWSREEYWWLGFELCSSVEAAAAPIEDPISPVTAVAFKLKGMIC